MPQALWFVAPALIVFAIAAFSAASHSSDIEPTSSPHLRVAGGLDPYTDPLPNGDQVSLKAAREDGPVPLLLPDVPGVAEDPLIVDVWMNPYEVFVEYPKGLFVTISVPDPGATAPDPSAEASFVESGGNVTQVADVSKLQLKDADVSIVSLEGAYSADQLTEVQRSIQAAS